ncbi:unnamed protein product [Victoria cruziana]
MRSQDQHSRILRELCSLVFGVLGSPISPRHCVSSPSRPVSIPTTSGRQPAAVTPSGLASLLLGVSLTLMLCGSLTFMIGFILMPWVLGLVTVLHMIGFVSSLSGLARLVLAPGASGPSKRGKELSD